MDLEQLFKEQTPGTIIITGKTKWVSIVKLPNGFHIAAKSGALTPCELKLINENDDDY